jgi:hypothetical protein
MVQLTFLKMKNGYMFMAFLVLALANNAHAATVQSTAQNYAPSYGLYSSDSSWEQLGANGNTGDKSGVVWTDPVRGDDFKITMHANSYITNGVYCYGCSERLKAWVDWDASGTFDSDEAVVNDIVTVQGTGDYNYSVYVPSEAPVGAWMRAVVVYYSSPGYTLDPAPTNAGNPAGRIMYGDVEDYLIEIPTTTTTIESTSTTMSNVPEFVSSGQPAAVLLLAPGLAYLAALISRKRDN